MPHRWIAAGRGAGTRALLALVVIGGCLGTVAYAATGPALGGGGTVGAAQPHLSRSVDRRPADAQPPRPLITKHPKKVSISSTASFAFKASRGNLGFQCRLDEGGWRGCRTPLVLRGLGAGDHRFAVRAVSRRGRRGAAARFSWKRVEPRPFAIEPQLASIDALYPGAGPVALPVVLKNPNQVSIFVTGLSVSVTADPPGCDSATNLALTSSSTSHSTPLRLPAKSSVSLPAASVSAPTIALRNLPVNQDACQGARFPLAFSGEAHG